MADRDPHVAAREMLNNWEKGLKPLLEYIEQFQDRLREAKRTVDTLDARGAGGTLAAPVYLKNVLYPLRGVASLSKAAADSIERVVRDAGE